MYAPMASAARAARGTISPLGPGAINYVKGLEEGEPEFFKTIWGKIIGTVDKNKRKDGKWEHNSYGRATLPGEKIEVLRELLCDSEWDTSNRFIKVHSAQILHGSGECAATLEPLLRLDMQVVDKLLGGSGPGGSICASASFRKRGGGVRTP